MSVSTTFKQAADIILSHEGGYVNDPVDKGGETNFGITKKTYDGWRKKRGLSPIDTMANIDWDDAQEFYYDALWKKNNLHKIEDPDTAIGMMDMLMGGPRRVLQLRQVLSVVAPMLLNFEEMGRDSIDTTGRARFAFNGYLAMIINQLNKKAPGIVLMLTALMRASHYLKIAQEEPAQQKFIRGWVDRAFSATNLRGVDVTKHPWFVGLVQKMQERPSRS